MKMRSFREKHGYTNHICLQACIIIASPSSEQLEDTGQVRPSDPSDHWLHLQVEDGRAWSTRWLMKPAELGDIGEEVVGEDNTDDSD